ncbi:MAG: hypothetical protein QOD77_231 [Thermoplasmata archaeon]|jgi:hypothetical protein|nr:hypothetical protein [Thermoplasmata archaeon]
MTNPRIHQKALLCLLAIALVAPASALIPSDAPTRTTASAQDGVLYSYTDPNTGSTAQLVAHDGALWCEWSDVAPPSSSAWVALYYFTNCKVQAVGGGAMACGSDNQEGSGAAVGSCRVASFIPSVDLQWWIASAATEITLVTATHARDVSVHVSEWRESGHVSVSGSLEATVGFVGRVVGAGMFSFSGSASYESSFEETDYQYHLTDRDVQIQERHATVLGLDGGFVNTVPQIERLDFDGATFGCDALNLVENLRGPRQLGKYANHLTARALTGELDTDLGNTRLKAVDNRGAFDSYQRKPNGFVATFDQSSASGSSGGLLLLGALVNLATDAADNNGMKRFDSSFAFTADYETPDVSYSTTMVSLRTGDSYRVQLTVPPTPLDRIVATRDDTLLDFAITTPDLAEYEGNLADLLADRLFDSPAGSMVFAGFDCPPSGGITANRNPQEWTSTASVQGYSGATNAAKKLGVDVYMDLNPY